MRARLSPEEERKLVARAQRGDMRAKSELFRSQEPLIHWLCKRFSGPDEDDLFSAACEGWMHALRTFRPGRSAFKTWMTWWVRAYASRATRQHLHRTATTFSISEARTERHGELAEIDPGDEGLGAEEMTDELWRRQAHGIIDGMTDRRLAVVLQERMRGQTLHEIADRHAKLLRLQRKNGGHEWVRQLEMRAIKHARALARAS